MDNKKRKISVEDDKGPAQAKRQKTEETEPGSEPAEHTNVNTEAKNFQSDKSRANSEPVTTEASIALKRSLLNSEELASSDGRSKETDAQQDENETNDELGVSASSTVIVTQDGTNSLLEIPLIPALPNTGQKSTCWTTTKSQLDEETEIGEPYQSENKQLSVLSKHGENTDAGISDGSVTSPLEKQAVNLRCNDTESEKTTTIDESDSILSTTHQLNVIENEVAKVDCPEPDRVTTASQPTQAEDNIDATQELDELRIGRETDRTDRVSPLGDILSPSEETFGTENEQQTSNGSNTEPTLLSVTVDPNDTDETHQVPAFPRNLDECSEHEKHIDGGIDINARDLILANAKAKALEEERIAEDKRSVLDASDNASCDLQESKPVSYSESVIHVQIADKRIETELKEINRQEVTHESTELPVVDVKPEKLEGENDEKLNDLVFPLPTIEAIAVEEHNIMSEKYNQEMASVSKTASLMDNAEITLQSTQSGESTENETQNVDEAKKPDYPYRYLYRLLRADEKPCEEGIRAKSPNATVSPDEHVRRGSKGYSSQYISTSATWSAITNLRAICRKTSNPKIAKIDCEGLSDVKYIDLTTDDNRSKYLSSHDARKYACRFDEVLVIGYIPASHCNIE